MVDSDPGDGSPCPHHRGPRHRGLPAGALLPPTAGSSSSQHATTDQQAHVPQLDYRQAATHLSLYQVACTTSLPDCHLSSQRFVASNTASTLAVSALSRISALPVANMLSRLSRIVTPTNTKFRSK